MTWMTTTYKGWGAALAATGRLARPERQRALADVSTSGPAIGNRRSYGDACLVDQGDAIDMTRLDRLLAFDAETGVLEVEAGAALGDILRVFAPKGWLPAVMPGTGYATVGGAIAMDVHGKNHHNAGSFGDHVEEITLLQQGREKTVKPGTALFRATVGGLGQTGIIARAKIRLKAVKGDVMVVTEQRAANWDALITLLDAADATYTVAWIDATATGPATGRGILEEGETGAGLVPKPKRGRKLPFHAPGFVLSPLVVQAFNALYWRRVPAAGRTIVKPIEDFFFPLDKIDDWNKLYGKAGFHQFQYVVPPDSLPALKEMFKSIVKSGLASPLAVLKRMGPGSDRLMSFPMEGYTLAVDMRAGPAAESLIAELEAATADAGGRIYLAKDALSSGAQIKAMYPGFDAYRKAILKADPDGVLQTDLVRRLTLREPM